MARAPVTISQPGDRSVDIVEIPAGTLLFKTLRLSDEPIQAERQLFADILGYPTETEFCLNPVQNVFTFPIPYVGFGLYDWTTSQPTWKKYNAFIAYVVTRDTKMVCQISPSKDVRGTGKGYRSPNSIIRRCDKFPDGLACAKTEASKKALQQANSYDNCINPARKAETGVNGWIAIAEGDSIDQQKGAISPLTTPMGAYVKTVAATDPLRARFIVENFYEDAHNHRGIPEIVLHSRLPSDPHITAVDRRPYSELDIGAEVGSLIAANKLQIIPFAVITSSGIQFTGPIASIKKPELSANDEPDIRRSLIELFLDIFFCMCLSDGVGDFGKLIKDVRTGFFVFPSFGSDLVKSEESETANFIFKLANSTEIFSNLGIEDRSLTVGGANNNINKPFYTQIVDRTNTTMNNTLAQKNMSTTMNITIPVPEKVSAPVFNTIGKTFKRLLPAMNSIISANAAKRHTLL